MLEALPDQAALLDSRGVIVRTNLAWRSFTVENGGDPNKSCTGTSYLASCATVESPEVQEVAEQLSQVIAGKLLRFTHEYPCHSPSQRRWFLMRAVHLEPGGALVTHTDITERRTAELHAEKLANHDPLTLVLNRRGFSLRLAVELARTRRHGGTISAILVDVDNFKAINSHAGHAVGDVVLVEMARRFCELLRAEDLLARIGGDEFLVLLPQTQVVDATLVAERLRLTVVSMPFVIKSGGNITVTCSASVATLTEQSIGLDDILRSCREGLAFSKSRGKNRTSGPRVALPDFRYQLLALRPRVVRQPIVRLDSGECVGYELLARGSGDLSNPFDIFHRAIEHNVLQQVDLACFRAGLKRLADLEEGLFVHLNLYPSTLLSLDIDRVLELVAPSHRRHLCIELCEQEIVGDPGYLRDKVWALRAEGISLAIDDVGFGRTCLENLIVLEPEVIKIDRRLTHRVAAEPGKLRQLARVVHLGRALDASLVVEGIEHGDDAAQCLHLGIPFGQGFFWGKPEEF